jgi:hypothetical protein
VCCRISTAGSSAHANPHVEAKHGADLSGAQGGDQAVEARPQGAAARRAAEIIVDDLDGDEAAPARGLDKLVPDRSLLSISMAPSAKFPMPRETVK